MTNDICTRAMLVSLRIKMWSARKYDKGISQEVARKYGATFEAGRYNKTLLPGDADSYKALTTVAGEARAKHYEQTLPWSDEGWRILPTTNWQAYTDVVRESQTKFDDSLHTFLSAYPTMRGLAKQLLNGMYKDEDYPSELDLPKRFGFSIEYNPIPTSDDFRISLPRSEVAAIAARAEDRVREAVRDAQQDAWRRLHENVSHIMERLADPAAIFRDTLIDNARGLVDVMDRLNIENDSRLTDVCNDIRSSLTTRDAETLRKKSGIRQRTANEAARILAGIEQVYKPA